MQLYLRATCTPSGIPPQSRAFGAGGGTIGRSPECTLALADVDRHISRVHAEIRQQGGGFFLKVLSRVNPVLVGGAPVGNGQMVELADGDPLRLGDYAFTVEISRQAAPIGAGAHAPVDDPFAIFDLPARAAPAAIEAPDPFFQPLTAASPAHPSWNVKPEAPAESGLLDLIHTSALDNHDPLLGIIGSDARAPDDRRVDQTNPFTQAKPEDDAVNRFLGVSAEVRVDSLDSALAGLSETTLPVGTGLGTHGDHVQDFNLPFSASLPPAPLSSPSPAGLPSAAMDDDIFASLAGPQTAGRQTPDLPLPGLRAPSPQSPDAGLPVPAAAEVVADDLFALLDSPATPMPAGLDGSSPPVHAVAAGVLPTPLATAAVVSAAPVAAAHVSPAGAPGPVAAGHASADLLARLAEGLNLSQPLNPADPGAFMEQLGQMLRISVEGVYALLQLRAEIKKELRAEDRTMIASRENNPLKHTESVDEALGYLLDFNAATPAFMPPLRAIEDAYKDMQAHEMAVMAGMRAGLAGVLKRFDPKTLETRIKKLGAFDSVVPAFYKAKLWDGYTEFYQAIEGEAEDHFDKLFGQAFVAAYLEQCKLLKPRH